MSSRDTDCLMMELRDITQQSLAIIPKINSKAAWINRAKIIVCCFRMGSILWLLYLIYGLQPNIAIEAVVENKGVTGIMKGIIIEQRQEQEKQDRLKEEREKNIIIYKVHETEGTPFNDRKAKDETLVAKIMYQLNRGDINVKSISRLGKFDPQKHKEGKTRPIKVSFHTKECRDSVMRKRHASLILPIPS